MFVLNKRYHHQMFRGLSDLIDLIREFFMCFGAIDSSHIARTEICIVRDHRLITALEVVILHPDLDRWIASHRYLAGGNSKIFYFHLDSIWGRFPFSLIFFSNGLKPPTRYCTYIFFHFCFCSGRGLVMLSFWAWYRNRTCQLGETWYPIINLTYANFREKLTTSWRLQECDNEHIMEVYCKDIKQDNPVSSSIHHWTYRSWMSFAYTCLYTFVLVQQHVEPTESEDIPVGLLCLLVGFCGIASGVMQSNLSWRWKWLHKINCGGIQHLKGCHVGWESIFLLANKMISWGLDSICETWF